MVCIGQACVDGGYYCRENIKAEDDDKLIDRTPGKSNYTVFFLNLSNLVLLRCCSVSERPWKLGRLGCTVTRSATKLNATSSSFSSRPQTSMYVYCSADHLSPEEVNLPRKAELVA